MTLSNLLKTGQLRKRNLSDYTGKDIDEASVNECRAEAARLLAEVTDWMKKNRPDLLK